MACRILGTTIFLTRGDTLRVQVDIAKDNEPYVLGNDDKVRFALKRSAMTIDQTAYVDTEPLIRKNIPVDTLLLQLDPEDTKALPFGEYAYDLQLTTADGVVDTFIMGILRLTPEVD